MGTLNRKKDYMTVSGMPGVAFEQDGKLFNARGEQAKATGTGATKKIVNEKSPVISPEEVVPGLKTEEARQEEIDKAFAEGDGATEQGATEQPDQEQTVQDDGVIIVDRNLNSYADRNEIMVALDKIKKIRPDLNVAYNMKAQRKTLLKILKQAVSKLDPEDE